MVELPLHLVLNTCPMSWSHCLVLHVLNQRHCSLELIYSVSTCVNYLPILILFMESRKYCYYTFNQDIIILHSPNYNDNLVTYNDNLAFDLPLFGFVCFLFLLVSGMGYGLRLWHSLDFFLTFFLTHLCQVDSSTTTVWTSLFLIAACLVSLYYYYYVL